MTLKKIIEEIKDRINNMQAHIDIENKDFKRIYALKQNELKRILPELEKAAELQEKTCKLIKKDEYDNIYYECSNCGMDWVFDDGTPKENEYNYCPHCGLKINHGGK